MRRIILIRFLLQNPSIHVVRLVYIYIYIYIFVCSDEGNILFMRISPSVGKSARSRMVTVEYRMVSEEDSYFQVLP